MLAVAVFPALSTAVPLIVCKPVVVVVIGEGHVRTPDRASEQVNVTVALVALIIPLAPGAGATAAVITGGVLSIFSVVVVEAVWPAASVAVAEIV
jgi:hypothetical protein